MVDLNMFITGTHAAFGGLAVLMGAVALAARKGAILHVSAGRLFAASMASSSILGALLGLMKFAEFYITFHAGVLGVTLILSGWLTARRRLNANGRWLAVIGVVNFLNVAGLVTAGLYALSLPETGLFGFQAADYLFLSILAGATMIGDLCLFLCADLSRKHRIAQHLSRMCIGFFIAAGSAFTGPGATAFPDVIRNSGVLSLPELIIISLMLFWLFRTLFWTPVTSEPAQCQNT